MEKFFSSIIYHRFVMNLKYQKQWCSDHEKKGGFIMSETMNTEELLQFINKCKGDGKIDTDKQIQAYHIGVKKSWELLPGDRKYYGQEDYRGSMDVNADGSIAFNVCMIIPRTEDAFNNNASSPVWYRKMVQELLYRKFMGYDLPYFKNPTTPEDIAIYNQVALEMGLPEFAIADNKVKKLVDKKPKTNSNSAKDENLTDTKSAEQHPEDDSEYGTVISNLVEHIGNVATPALAAGAVNNIGASISPDEMMKTEEFTEYVTSMKQVLESFLNCKKIKSGYILRSYKELADKYGSVDVKAKSEVLTSTLTSINEFIGAITDSDKFKTGVRNIINKLSETDLDVDSVLTAISNLAGDCFGIVAKYVVDSALAECREDAAEAIIKLNEILAQDDIEVLDQDGKVVASFTGKANGDKAKKSPVQKIAEAVPAKYTEKAADGTEIEVSLDRHNKFKKHNSRFIKEFPGLNEFSKMVPEGSFVKYDNYKGIVSAEVYDTGKMEPFTTLYIDPAKINDYYSIIISRTGSNLNLDPLRDVYCPFQYAGSLVHDRMPYTEKELARDIQTTMINRSFYTHVCYSKFPKEDLAIVIGRLTRFVDTLESMGLDVRFDVTDYENPGKFSLICGKVGLYKLTRDNKHYMDLRIDVRHGENTDALLLRASGSKAEEFASKVNTFAKSAVIDLAITDEQFYAQDVAAKK
jgi:hypothetical protein